LTFQVAEAVAVEVEWATLSPVALVNWLEVAALGNTVEEEVRCFIIHITILHKISTTTTQFL
jgi:hypothetical protein